MGETHGHEGGELGVEGRGAHALAAEGVPLSHRLLQVLVVDGHHVVLLVQVLDLLLVLFLLGSICLKWFPV